MFNALTARSDTVSAFVGLFANRLLWAAIGLSVAAQVLVVHLPGLNTAFGAVPLTPSQWAISAGLAAGVLAIAEVAKTVIRRRIRAESGRSALGGSTTRPDNGVERRGVPS